MLLADEKYCAVDIETTGLNVRCDEMLSFASVPIRNSRIIVHESYYTLVQPEKYRIDAMKYHGISEGNLAGAPSFEDVAHEMLGSLDGILVGHSIEYDYMFLKRYFKRIGVKLKKDFIDIILVERWLEQQSGKLGQDMSFEAILRRYGLSFCYRHNALADAFFAAQVFQMQMAAVMDLGLSCPKELIRVINRHCYAIW